jgi:hypothetical protein
MGVVEQALANRVGERGLLDVGMPLLDRELAGDDGGMQVVAILEHLEQILALLVLERGEGEVVDDEHVGA